MSEPTTEATAQPPQPRRLGDFELFGELGRGGMGVVYEARQVSLNRKVALKVLAAGLGLTPKAVERFRREAEAAAKLHHTNIVPVYATGETHGTHYYAMELIEGPSLDRVIRQMRQGQKLPPGGEAPEDVATCSRGEELAHRAMEIIGYAEGPSSSGSGTGPGSSALGSGGGYFDTLARLVAEVADALHYAHAEGVIHRDIKPSNLLLSPIGRLSINDFGLARILEQPGMTLTGEFVGSPLYMSPEQIAVGRVALDHRTDIYSLGATLYQLLTLRPPFAGERRDQVIAQILYKEPKPPRRLNKKVPVDLETICLKALEKDPDRRYQTAGQMAEDLRRYVNRFAISARRVGPIGRLVKWARRRPAVAAALGCAVVAIAVAGFFAYRAQVSEHQQHREERRQAALEKALLAAFSGDFNEADKAIQEAEQQGASTGQVRLLRGQVAYYRGEKQEAIQHLEQAVRLLPVADSAAARGLLLTVYSEHGRADDYDRGLRELEPIVPVTLEDYLFKGWAVSPWEPERGLELMNEAVNRRPSSALARLFRADILIWLAQDRGEARIADLAIEDVKIARKFLPENSPIALSESGLIHQQAAAVYQFTGQREKHRAAVAQAEKDTEALKGFPSSPNAITERLWFFRYFGQKDRALEESLRLGKQTNAPWIALECGVISILARRPYRSGGGVWHPAKATGQSIL